MHGTIITPPQMMSAARAEVLAATMQAGDPDWKYTAQHTPGGLSKVEVRDEEGEFVAYL